MDEQNTGFIPCDVSFNGQLVADVKLPRACSVGNIVQGLWLDDNFRKTGLEYLKTKEDKDAQKSDGGPSSPLKSFGGIDRSILRANVAIRIMPAWKWLEFKDFIADFENKKDCYTVGDVFGTLCTGTTGLYKPVLRIMPKSENEADDQEVKNIVNELLKTTSLATMAAAGCPLSNGMLSLIAQGKYSSTIGHDKCQAFVCWLRQQDLSNVGLRSPEQQAETVKPNYLALPAPQPKKSFKPRITFSQNEIDTLTEWFNADERPSKEAMNQFTDILNIPRQMASIRLLTYESIYFWFKNKRSKKRKAESSLLEPWEPCYKNESTVVAPEVTMAIAPYAAVTTESTSTIVSTPRVTMETQEGSCAPISIAITNQSGGEVRVPINGLATMLAKCTAQNTLLDGGESSSKPRKIPKSRVTFDPQAELPFLNKWFDDEERPEKEVIEEYTNILNAERSPKSKRLLTPESIAMWFKNRRAKKRRTEISIDYSAEDSRQVVLRAGEENKQEEASDATSTITDETPDVHVPVEAGEENKHERASEAVTSTGMDETPDMHVAVDVTTLSSGS